MDFPLVHYANMTIGEVLKVLSEESAFKLPKKTLEECRDVLAKEMPNPTGEVMERRMRLAFEVVTAALK